MMVISLTRLVCSYVQVAKVASRLFGTFAGFSTTQTGYSLKFVIMYLTTECIKKKVIEL